MAERDTGLLAPFDIKSKAEKFAKDLRIAEDTNYDQADNKYDAIRHIGASLALYAQYPDLASDAILNVKEYVFGLGDPKGQKMDLHNNEIGKKLYEMLDEEQADNLTTEQALEIAKSYVEEWDLAEKEGRQIDLPEEMKPIIYYGPTKEPATKEEDGGLYEIGPEGTWVEKAQMDEGGLMSDPLVLSETAEEEAEPKMGIGEYVSELRQFGEDISPAGTADALIETVKEGYKLGTGAEDASVMNLLMSGIGAIPGGKQAGKVIQASGRFGKKAPETTFGIGDTVAPPVDKRSAKKVKDIEGKIADFHGGMGAKVDDIYVGDDGKTKVVVRYMKDTDEINPETNTPVFEEVTQIFDADQAEKMGLETLVKGKQPEIIPVKLAEAEDMNTLNKILTAEYGDPDEYSQVLEAIAGSLYDAGKLGDVQIGKRFKNANGDIVEVTGVDATLAPYPTKELAGKSDRTYFEVGVDKPVGIQIQYKNLTRGTEGSDIFDNFKGGKYEEVTGELKQVEQPQTGLMVDDIPTPVAGKLDVEDAEFKKLQSAWKERTGKGENKEVSRRFEEMTEAAQKVQSGELSVAEFRKLADKTKPVTQWDFVPEPATYEDMFFALDSRKRTKPFLGYDIELEDGVRTTSRLDIPAYTENDVWVVTLKGGKDAADGQTIYSPAVRLKNVDLFQDVPLQRKSLKIAAGGGKGPHAVISGDYVKESSEDTYKLAQEALNSKEWTQVGYDPTRRGYFYDRKTMEPVLSGDDMVQVGPLVLVKNAKKGKPEDFEFNAGGLMSGDYNRAES